TSEVTFPSIRRRAAEAVAAHGDVVDVPAERPEVRVAGEAEADGHRLAGVTRQVHDDLLEHAEAALDEGGTARQRAGRPVPKLAVVPALDDRRPQVFEVAAGRNLQHAAVEGAGLKLECMVEH